jgi:hypothetical protein
MTMAITVLTPVPDIRLAALRCPVLLLLCPQPYKPEGDDPEPEYKDYHEDSYEHKHGHKGHKDYHHEEEEPEYEEEYAKIEVRARSGWGLGVFGV